MALKHSDIARTLHPFTLHAQHLMSQARADVAAHAAVHGYAVASGSAAGVLVVAALLGGILINAHPGRIRAELPPSPELADLPLAR